MAAMCYRSLVSVCPEAAQCTHGVRRAWQCIQALQHQQAAALGSVVFGKRMTNGRNAIRVYTLILQGNPSDTTTLAQRAYAYSQLQDPKAFDDFTTAANLGDAYSQNALGQYIYNGVPGHIPRDHDRAIEWFRKAAAQGNEMAKKNLAIALTGG
jgi:TPR repeat protein